MSNTCGMYDNCVNKYMTQMQYPMDNKALYTPDLREYEKQIARARCYNKNPVNIVEGFDGYLNKWGNVIQFVVIVCLVVLFISLINDWPIKMSDYSNSNNTIIKGGFSVNSMSEFEMTPIFVGGVRI